MPPSSMLPRHGAVMPGLAVASVIIVAQVAGGAASATTVPDFYQSPPSPLRPTFASKRDEVEFVARKMDRRRRSSLYDRRAPRFYTENEDDEFIQEMIPEADITDSLNMIQRNHLDYSDDFERRYAAELAALDRKEKVDEAHLREALKDDKHASHFFALKDGFHLNNNSNDGSSSSSSSSIMNTTLQDFKLPSLPFPTSRLPFTNAIGCSMCQKVLSQSTTAEAACKLVDVISQSSCGSAYNSNGATSVGHYDHPSNQEAQRNEQQTSTTTTNTMTMLDVVEKFSSTSTTNLLTTIDTASSSSNHGTDSCSKLMKKVCSITMPIIMRKVGHLDSREVCAGVCGHNHK